MKRRWWLAVVVVVILAVSSLTALAQDVVEEAGSNFTGNGPFFRDVAPDYWAYNYIQAIARANITKGCMKMRPEDCPDGGSAVLYCPEGILTRAEMAAFVGRAMRFGFHLQHFNEYFPALPTFVDIAGNGLAPWIEAIANPVAAGAPEGTKPVTIGCQLDAQGLLYYCPVRAISRAEMAVFLARTMSLNLGQFDPARRETWAVEFQDVSTNNWAWKEIQAIFQAGITIGCRVMADGTIYYCPEESVTRAQMAAFLARAFLGMT